MKNTLKQQIKSLNIKNGDTLLIHSSFSSVGKDISPETLIQAFTEVLGDEGTLVFPALSYSICTRENPVFDYFETGTCVGFLPEYFRTKVVGVKRSMHPTHSCTALGYNTNFLLEDHHLDDTPCGPNSPFRKLMEADGKIMFLGCSSTPNTSMHAIEELSSPDYLYGDSLSYSLTKSDKTEYNKVYRTHGFKNTVQRYERAEELLSGDEITRGVLQKADCIVMSASALWEKAHGVFIKEPHHFVDIIQR